MLGLLLLFLENIFTFKNFLKSCQSWVSFNNQMNSFHNFFAKDKVKK